MSTNSVIADRFEEMASFLEIIGENPFRSRAYERAAMAVRGLTKSLEGNSEEELLAIPGIGKGMTAHIEELLRTGKLSELEKLKEKFPPGLLDIVRVPGLGPKRARLLYEKMGIGSIEQLKSAVQDGGLRSLPGFGAKLEEGILKGLALAQEKARRMQYWSARLLLDDILKRLKLCREVVDLVPCGSFRRGMETVGDLDILCTARDGEKVMDFFTKLPQVERVIAAGKTKSSVWLKSQIQCDLRVVPPTCLGASMMYFTGSKQHNVALREMALKKGYSINEYGLFRASDKKHAKPLAGTTEKEVYSRLGLDWIPPEIRENRGEIDAAQKHRLPDLISVEDVRGDPHTHTDYSDGLSTCEELIDAAQKLGWGWLGLGDHSVSVKVANGLSVERFKKSMLDVRCLAQKYKNIGVLRTMEVDILKDGRLDYPDDILSEIDVVIAAVHSSMKQPRFEMTERIRSGILNPDVDGIAHISGRLIGRRDPYDVDLESLLDLSAKNQTFFEINGQPERQDISDVHARRAKEMGVSLMLCSDAHSAAELAYIELAVLVARRAWLEKRDVLNSLSFKEICEWFEIKPK